MQHNHGLFEYNLSHCDSIFSNELQKKKTAKKIQGQLTYSKKYIEWKHLTATTTGPDALTDALTMGIPIGPSPFLGANTTR